MLAAKVLPGFIAYGAYIGEVRAPCRIYYCSQYVGNHATGESSAVWQRTDVGAWAQINMHWCKMRACNNNR